MNKIIISLSLIITLISCSFYTVMPTRAQGTLKIGLIGPYGLPQWGGPYSPLTCGMWEGASLATMEINSAGGIDVGGIPYTIVLEPANEHSVPTPNPTAAYDEFVRLLEIEMCEYIIGGYNPDVTSALISASVDYSMYSHLFLINGASDDQLIDGTVPHLFRVMPTNTTTMFNTLAAFSVHVIQNYGLYHGDPQVKIAVLAEDLDWTVTLYTNLTNPAIYPSILGPFANVTYAARVDPLVPDWTSIWTAVKGSGAVIVIHMFSGLIGTQLVTSFRDNNVEATLIGINAMAQLQTHWASTTGKGDFETIINQFGTRTRLVPGKTEVFWDNFVGNYSYWPVSTAFGAYDAIYMLKEAIEAIDSTDPNLIQAYLDDPSFERMSLLGKFKFTPLRDVYSNEFGQYWTQGYVRPLMVQWQAGDLEVVWPFIPYSQRYNFGYDTVRVTDVVPYRTVISQGCHLPINVTVTNLSLLPAYYIIDDIVEGFGVFWAFYDNETIGVDASLFGQQLEIGESETFVFDWNTTGVEEGNYTISAYEEARPKYAFVDDVVWVRWSYDVTGDNYCGIDDIIAVAGHFGTSPGHPDWNIIFDVNCNDYVGIDDIVEVAEHFGESA